MAGSPLTFDSPAEEKRIVRFIRRVVKEADVKGVVVGMSGGIDSSVVSALCVKALGKDRVLGLLMPSNSTPPRDMEDARILAFRLGIRTREIRVSDVADSVFASVRVKGPKLAQANVQARTRMVVLYFFANTLRFLVAGTGDRSESEIGFFTKFGDGGADFLPIVHLYKTQVRELGRNLGIPMPIVSKPSSPQLWPGHKATDEIPADYDVLDPVLYYLFDAELPPQETASKSGVGMSLVKKVLVMNRRSAHKRNMPKSLAAK